MTYRVEVEGRVFEVEMTGDVLSVDGHRLQGDWRRVGAGEYSIVAEGHAAVLTLIVVERSRAALRVRVSGPQGDWLCEVTDPRRLPAGGQVQMHGSARVCAAIAGKVVRVLVQPGDTVEAGQALLVLEAMKMQNEVRSPKAGRVARIAVGPGETVPAGRLLAELE